MAIEDGFVPGTATEIALFHRILELKHSLYEASRMWQLEKLPPSEMDIGSTYPAPKLVLPMTEYICLDETQRLVSVNAVSWAGKEKPGKMWTCRYSLDLDMFRDTG